MPVQLFIEEMTDVAATTTTEVVPAELEQFVALGLTGRRNALGDVLDENVTKTSTKTLVEKLHRLQSTGRLVNLTLL